MGWANIRGKHTYVNVGSWQPAGVTLPPVPGIQITVERPETEPPRGIVSAPQAISVVERRVAATREAYEEWRAEA